MHPHNVRCLRHSGWALLPPRLNPPETDRNSASKEVEQAYAPRKVHLPHEALPGSTPVAPCGTYSSSLLSRQNSCRGHYNTALPLPWQP